MVDAEGTTVDTSAAILESRVIPTGVDLTVFHPAEKDLVRSQLGLSYDAKIILFTANGIRKNIWKDYKTMEAAVRLLSERFNDPNLIFLAVGEDSPPEHVGKACIRFVPHLRSFRDVALYYQAADIYVHAAAADTFPRSILEALACGLPVVATRVGGIPEQVRSLEDGNDATGILISPKDVQGLALGLEKLLRDPDLCRVLGKNAAMDARIRFDVKNQAGAYLNWYESLVSRDEKLSRFESNNSPT